MGYSKFLLEPADYSIIFSQEICHVLQWKELIYQQSKFYHGSLEDRFLNIIMIRKVISKVFLIDFIARVKESSFIKNAFIVMSGTAIAQIIGFAITPIISRLYTPSDFGIFGSFNAVSTVVSAVATLEYTQAIFLPKEKGEAINLFCVSCLCTFCVSFLCLIICLIAPSFFNRIMQTSNVWAIVLLIISIFVSGINQSCQSWCVRSKAFNQTSISQVVRSISSNGMQIVFGYFKLGPAGLVISSVMSNLLSIINLFRVVISDIVIFRNCIQLKRMKHLAKDYRDFPMYAATQNIATTLSQGLPVLLLTYYYGIAIAGAYSFGVKILQAPMSLVLSALRQVLLQRASEDLHRGNNLMPLYVKVTSGLCALSFFPLLILFIWAPQLFIWVFGANWLMAGEFAQSLVLWLMIAFCNLPAVLFAQLIRIQRTVLLYDMVVLALRASFLILGGIYLSAQQTIMLFALMGAIMNVILILIVGLAIKKKEYC